MLEITVPATQPVELFDESTNEFILVGSIQPAVTLQLEHSLASLSKWEEIWEKPFLDDAPRTKEETIGYIKAMCLTPDVPSEVFDRLSPDNHNAISNYIGKKMTATWFVERPGTGGRQKEIITAEIIYYWMLTLTIPPQYEFWHLNKLFTLIKVANEKNDPKKNQGPKIGRNQLAAQRKALNDQRRQQHNTSG